MRKPTNFLAPFLWLSLLSLFWQPLCPSSAIGDIRIFGGAAFAGTFLPKTEYNDLLKSKGIKEVYLYGNAGAELMLGGGGAQIGARYTYSGVQVDAAGTGDADAVIYISRASPMIRLGPFGSSGVLASVFGGGTYVMASRLKIRQGGATTNYDRNDVWGGIAGIEFVIGGEKSTYFAFSEFSYEWLKLTHVNTPTGETILEDLDLSNASTNVGIGFRF